MLRKFSSILDEGIKRTKEENAKKTVDAVVGTVDEYKRRKESEQKPIRMKGGKDFDLYPRKGKK